jgi:hypothetical protein
MRELHRLGHAHGARLAPSRGFRAQNILITNLSAGFQVFVKTGFLFLPLLFPRHFSILIL